MFLAIGKKRWIELNEGGVNRAVSGVAGIAVGRGGNHFAGVPVVEAEEGPLTGEARFVLDVNFAPHNFGALIASLLIDGAFVDGAAHFENEHRFVGPGAGFNKFLVRLRIHEDVVEHVVAHLHAGRVAHVESGGEVDPFAIIFGKLELRVAGVLDHRVGCRILCKRCCEGEKDRDDDNGQELVFHGRQYG